MEVALWDDYSSAFMNYFFSKELRDTKVEVFVNLNQERMMVK